MVKCIYRKGREDRKMIGTCILLLVMLALIVMPLFTYIYKEWERDIKKNEKKF